MLPYLLFLSSFFFNPLFFNARSCNNLQPFFFFLVAFTKRLFHFVQPFNSLLDFIKDTTHPHTKSVVQLMMRREGEGGGFGISVGWDMIYSPSFEDNKCLQKWIALSCSRILELTAKKQREIKLEEEEITFELAIWKLPVQWHIY